MEIKPEEIKTLIDDPLTHYKKSFKSAATAETQTRALKKILCEFLAPVLKGNPALLQKITAERNALGLSSDRFSRIDFEVRAREFVQRSKEDPKWAEAVIMKIMHKLEERTKLDKSNPDYLSRGAARNYYFPIQRLLESGGVELPWKRIRRTVPKQTGHGGRAWEHAEIRMMLAVCNSEEKPLVIIPATSGIREGGLWFRWEHIFTVYRYDNHYYWEYRDVTDEIRQSGRIICGLIHVYADSQDDDDYFGLITPEALEIIEEYRQFWKERWGSYPKPKDPFFSKQGPTIKPLKESGIRNRMEIIQERCGLRPKLAPNVRRHEVQPFTGFRKFFDKVTKKATSKNSLFGKLILNEKMMGHDGMIRLNKNYFREVISELIDEYIPAIPGLTITDAAAKRLEPVQSPPQDELSKALEEIRKLTLWKSLIEAHMKRENMAKFGKTDPNS